MCAGCERDGPAVGALGPTLGALGAAGSLPRTLHEGWVHEERLGPQGAWPGAGRERGLAPGGSVPALTSAAGSRDREALAFSGSGVKCSGANERLEQVRRMECMEG